MSFQISVLLQVPNKLGWFINSSVESEVEIVSGELRDSPWVSSCLWT